MEEKIMGEFKTGDVVQLKSGGPKMTVNDPFTHSEIVLCQWFSGSKLESGIFDPETLVKINDEQSEK